MQTAFLQNNDKSRHVYKYLLPLPRLRGVSCNKDKWKFQVHISITLTQSLWSQGGEGHKRKWERHMRFFERTMANNDNSEPLSSVTLFSHSGTVIPQVITCPLLCYLHIPMICSIALTTALQLPARHVLKALCSRLWNGLELSSLWLIYLQALPHRFLAETSVSLVSPSTLLGFGFIYIFGSLFPAKWITCLVSFNSTTTNSTCKHLLGTQKSFIFKAD